jgi:exodeoxyribonuclease V alpha subunit
LDEVAPAYAVTIHKSQGSEFPAVVIPLATQHYMLLQRNLIYTAITRGKKLVLLIGQKKALGIAVHNDRPQRRYSGLLASLRNEALMHDHDLAPKATKHNFGRARNC